MCASPFSSITKLSNKQSKFIKRLRLKKYRQQESAFVVEGDKSVRLLLASDYTVQLVVGTPAFLAAHSALWRERDLAVFQADEDTLASLGTLQTTKTALAVASQPAPSPMASDAWGLALDDIRDPGNLGTIVRIADWYNIPTLVCSPNTVDLYNPKVLQASMGSFTRVQVHYTPLPTYLSQTAWPVWGTFTTGVNVHHTPMPLPGWIVIGNEANGISADVLPYIQERISIPRYGQAESLNAAMATAIVCDNWQRMSKSR
ncbi:MAG: RNA methyltransferase [Roseivirga sp.]